MVRRHGTVYLRCNLIVNRSAEGGSGNRACRGLSSDDTWESVGIWRTGQERCCVPRGETACRA